VKRFWKEVTTVEEPRGHGLRLDGKPVRTPAREPLFVPSERLCEAIAREWRAVGAEFNPRDMPLTGLANGAVDRIAPDPTTFAAGLAKYAEGDLLFYRAEGPAPLVSRQAELWDPLLGWARRRFDVDFRTTSGLMHVPQPQATVDRLSHAIHALDAFALAGLAPVVTIGGSLVVGLAVYEKAFSVEQGWEAVSIDEHWQLEQWGEDAEARMALENRRRDFLAGAQFLELLGP
jgi:chaperone required for assembly of F1-ATPase